MKRNISLWQFAGFALSALGGTLLHFLYDITGKSILAAPFSGVNESTWEHMKLLFFPLFIFAVVQSFFFKGYVCFWCVKLKGVLIGMVMIPVIFYTCNGVFGKTADWFNITIFFISAAVTFIAETRYFRKKQNCKLPPVVCFGTICFIGVLFVVFTFAVPRIPLFKDPLTGGYGII